MVRPVYVLGGGVTGLAVAYELLKRGQKVEIIEKSASIGGLAKTERWKGRPIDMGPHIYHTPDKDIKDYFLTEFQGLFHEREHWAKNFKNDKFYDYPISREFINSLPDQTRDKINNELDNVSPDDLSKAIMLKDISSAKDTLKRFGKNKDIDQLIALLNIYGDSSVLDELEKLDKDNYFFTESVKNLKIISEKIKQLNADVTFDFSEIRGYQYHKGIIFTAYADGFTSAIAQGGRYDNLNELLGIKRPATGFSLDLRYLINNL